GNARSYFLNIKKVTTVSDDHKTSTGGTVTVVADIPAGTVIKGDLAWDGIIAPPTATEVTVTIPDFTTLVSSAIAIGSSDSDITFSKGVRLLFVGQKDQLIGWYNHAGTFSEITSVCVNDSQSTGDALPEGGNCKINVGSDLVVWTKHFSTFTTYTKKAIVKSSGGRSGSSHSSDISTVALSSGKVLGASTEELNASTTGKVLGASTFQFTSHLRRGASSDSVKQLQERLRAEGFFTYPTSTGYFGPITFAAVKAYQVKHGILSTGFVGILTTAELNK
ncbi:MAG: peptidoglycan-binding domain-containing protein, partial [Candidatus Paceibacterota bacterium]